VVKLGDDEKKDEETSGKPKGLEVKEEGGKKYYKCPNCGEWVDHFDWYGNIRSPMCPKYKRLVRRDLVPPEAIVWKPAQKKKKKKTEEDEKVSEAKRKYELERIAKEIGAGGETAVGRVEEEASKEMEEYQRSDSLFETPKPPARVVFEVLSAYKHINPEFIRAMVRRAQRKGTLSPDELKFFLMSMKSGVKGEVEAQFIADEYAYALEQEAEKARKLGYPYPYSHTFGSRPYPQKPSTYTYPSSGYYGSQTYYQSDNYTYPTYNYPTYRSQSQAQQPQQGVSREELMRMMEEMRRETQQMMQQMMQQLIERKKREELEDKLHQLEMKQLEMQQQMVNMIKTMKDEFMQMMGQIVQQAQQPPPGVVTRDELEKMFLDKYTQLLEKQLEYKDRVTEQWREQVGKLMEEIKELRQEQEKQKLELLKQLEEVKKKEPIVYKPEGYKEDAFRLLAESVHHLADVIKERKPVETAIKAMAPAVTGQPVQPPKPQLKETRASKSRVEEYLEGTEFVVEE